MKIEDLLNQNTAIGAALTALIGIIVRFLELRKIKKK